MKKSGRCPKCDSIVIGRFPDVRQFIAAKPDSGPTFNDCKMFQLEAYVCGECGYYEEYLARLPAERKTPLEESDLEFVWVRPPPPKDGPFR